MPKLCEVCGHVRPSVGMCPRCFPAKKGELKKGEWVQVWEDPYTRNRFEGNAVLIDRSDLEHHDSPDWQYWMVLFEGRNEQVVQRLVSAEDLIRRT